MIIEINDINLPELEVYSSLTEAQLRNHGNESNGLFIAESPKVIRVAIQNGYEPESMLCEKKHINGDASDIIRRFKEMPVYTGERNLLASLTGYKLTRGVLCAMKRKSLPSFNDICENAHSICVLQGITDTTNIGSIFRSASALGVDALILSSDTCDPFNRRAVRVSMGTVFTIPWTFASDPVNKLKQKGFATAALALEEDSISLNDPTLKKHDKIAMIFGTEGDGLPKEIISLCDYIVKIPMSHGVDSLNVAAAAAVTFWEIVTK